MIALHIYCGTAPGDYATEQVNHSGQVNPRQNNMWVGEPEYSTVANPIDRFIYQDGIPRTWSGKEASLRLLVERRMTTCS